MIDQAILNDLSAIAQNYETCDFEFIKKEGNECLMLKVEDSSIRIIPYTNGDYLLLINTNSDGYYFSEALEHTSEIDTFYFLDILTNLVAYYNKGDNNSFSIALKGTYYRYRLELKRREERL